MRGYDFHMVMHIGTPKDDQYFVEIYTQSFYRKLIAWVYHWYDMRVFKIPGFKLLENIKQWFYRNKNPLDYLPISANQDLRCHYLNEKGRVTIARFEITKEQYLTWKGCK